MLLRERDVYGRFLTERADQFAKEWGIPIDVVHLCSVLEVRIVQHALERNKALLVQTKGGIEIRIPCASIANQSLSPYQRYLVAHELGHHILAQQFAAAPLNKSEYWQHETLCDEFAAKLLLPNELIHRNLAASTPSRRVFSSIGELARAAQTPVFLVAKRICDAIRNIAVFQVMRQANGYFRITRSALPRAKEFRRQIPATTELGARLSTLSDAHSAVTLPNTAFADDTIPSCKGASEGIAVLGPLQRIDVVVTGRIPHSASTEQWTNEQSDIASMANY